MKKYYLDNAASTPISKSVLAAMLPFLTEKYYNPNSLYPPAREVRDAVEKARAQVAKLINANPENIVFTSGGTEANNMAISLCNLDKDSLIISTKMEHDSMYNAILAQKCDQLFLKCANKNELLCELKEALESNKGRDIITSIMFINNELGIVLPVKEIGSICKEHNSVFITDCVQALGNEFIDVNDICCDYASISAHKIYGPMGVGALYIKDIAKAKLNPFIYGGSHQEKGIRSGTENVPGIIGFGMACENASNINSTKTKMSRRRKAFIDEINKSVEGIRINCDSEDSKIISITIDGIYAESLVYMVALRGVYISSGSACNSKEQEPSRALLAYGMSNEDAKSTVRISLNDEISEEDIRKAAKIISESAITLRKYNTNLKGE